MRREPKAFRADGVKSWEQTVRCSGCGSKYLHVEMTEDVDSEPRLGLPEMYCTECGGRLVEDDELVI